MSFQGSGFSIELPPGAMDASAYVFSFPELGELSPNISVRFETGENVDMEARRRQVCERIRDTFPNAVFKVEDETRRRGDWEYFTNVVEFGEDSQKLCQKELHLKIMNPGPTVYVFSGTDLLENFDEFEPTFDAIVRSFQPNDIQRLN